MPLPTRGPGWAVDRVTTPPTRAVVEGVDLESGDVRVIGLETRIRLPNGYVEELEVLPVRYTVPGLALSPYGGTQLEITVHTSRGDRTVRIEL
jgi:hypothetical protein